MDPAALQRRLGSAVVARLATVSPGGKPHVAPICYAIQDGTLYFAVDAKPKRTTELQRLKNIRANPSVCVLVDHYEDDWSKLWWIRIDGTARILSDPLESARAIDLLASRYIQYRRTRPRGPVVAIAMDRVSHWTGS